MYGFDIATATAPAGLTRAERKEATRQAVAAAAAAHFASHGIEASSVEQIASSLGLTRGAVYASYASKRDLVRAVGEEQTILLDFTCLWRDDLRLCDRLRLLGAQVARFSSEQSSSPLVLDLEYLLYAVRHQDESKERFERYAASAAYIGERLQEVAVSRGERLPLPPPLFGRLLVATLRGLLQEDLRQGKRLTSSELSDVLAQLGGGA